MKILIVSLLVVVAATLVFSVPWGDHQKTSAPKHYKVKQAIRAGLIYYLARKMLKAYHAKHNAEYEEKTHDTGKDSDFGLSNLPDFSKKLTKMVATQGPEAAVLAA